jgi:hypothetical protein
MLAATDKFHRKNTSNYEEATYHRAGGEGSSSRAHGLPYAQQAVSLIKAV